MDIDLGDSDMSRLTTMLTRVSAPFERSYGPNAIRLIEIGNVEFAFRDDGALFSVAVAGVGGVDLPDDDDETP